MCDERTYGESVEDGDNHGDYESKGCHDLFWRMIMSKFWPIREYAYRNRFGNELTLERVRIYETPNCWADAKKQ
jgi:hypothetical protein